MNRIKRILGKPERSSNWLAGVVVMAVLAGILVVVNLPKVEAQAESDSQDNFQQIWVSSVGVGIEYSEDFSEIIKMRPTDKIIVEERKGDTAKQLIIAQPQDASLTYTYNVSGQEQPVDDSVMTWYAEIWKLIANANVTGDFGSGWQVRWSQSDGFVTDDDGSSRITGLSNAFGFREEGKGFISYVKETVSGFPSVLSAIQIADTLEDGTLGEWKRLIDEPDFSARGYILQAVHVLSHQPLVTGGFGTEASVRQYIEDLFREVALTPEDLQATLQLIQEVRTPDLKKEMLLEYLDEVSSMNEPELEQLSTLATNEQKLQRLLELAPELPSSASSYSLYMKQAASLPDEMDQAAIRELTNLLYTQVRTATSWGTGDGTAINYNGFSLVITSKDAVAIVDFFDPFDYSRSSNELRGVAYRYRALEKGGQEQTSEGIVYENYQSVPSGEPDEFNVITSQGGNMLWVNAGPITFEWSHGTDLGGWAYVDNLNPMLENETSFEDFNLQTILGENAGLEQPVSFTPPFDNAEVVNKFGEQGNSVALRAPSTETPVKAMGDGVILNAFLAGMMATSFL